MSKPIDMDAARRKRCEKAPSTPGSGWEGHLQRDQHERVKKSLANVMTILAEHPAWSGVLAYDAFAESIVSRSEAPTRSQDRPAIHAPSEWSEADSVRTVAWISDVYRIDVGVQIVEQAVVAVARRNVFHPVVNYLRALKWDCVQRLPTLLSSYFGADATDYSQAIGIRFMISAVARVERPGCKVDNLVIFEGPQGIGKSTAARLLAVRPEWFADTGIVLGDKDSFQNLRDKWLYELGELSSIRSARDVERIKAFLSAPVDSYRPSFGRRRADFPRQTVFIGTTNEQEYFADRTGNRRFWPVRCGRIDLAGIERDRDQLWAEAVVRYDSGEKWHVDSRELVLACREQQEEREQVDPWVPIVAKWLKDPTVPDLEVGGRTKADLERGITTTEVLLGAIAMHKSDVDKSAETRAGQVLRDLGFVRGKQAREGGGRVRRYTKVSLPTTQVDELVTGGGDSGGDVEGA